MNTKELRQKILDLAIHGKLVPQDPNDEPASVLLERIKAEKERLIKEGKIKRAKKSAKFSDTPHYGNVPFEVPNGWVWCKLGDIFQHNNGKQKTSSNQNGKLLKYITTSNVYWGRFDLSEIKEMRFLESELAKCTAKRGDLLVCEGGDIGRAAIWDYDQIICFQNHLHRLRGFVPICTKYFLFSLMFCKIKGLIKGKGIGLMTLSANDLHNIPIPLPPLAEQQRIVTEVDRWFALIDQIEQNQSDLQVIIKNTKNKILDLAIHGRLVPQDPNDEPASELLKRINPKAEITCDNGHYTQLPDGWVVVPMQMLCSLTDGEKLDGKEMPNLDVKYLRGERDFKTLTNGRYVAANSLLILVDGENSGEVFRTPIDGYQGSTFKQLYINKQMLTDYVLLVINLHRKALRENKVGSAIPHLNKKLFRAIQVPIPPYNEQKKIVDAVKTIFKYIDAIMENL